MSTPTSLRRRSRAGSGSADVGGPSADQCDHVSEQEPAPEDHGSPLLTAVGLGHGAFRSKDFVKRFSTRPLSGVGPSTSSTLPLPTKPSSPLLPLTRVVQDAVKRWWTYPRLLGLLTVLAFLIRARRLGSPQTPVFDESYMGVIVNRQGSPPRPPCSQSQAPPLLLSCSCQSKN